MNDNPGRYLAPSIHIAPEVSELARRIVNRLATTEPDPLLDDLARLLNDPRLPDALAESVRAQLGETVYQLRHAVGEIAA